MLVIIDDFLPDEDFMLCKQNLHHLFDQTGKSYRWWDGWWSEPPSNICEALIEKIHREINPLKKFGVMEDVTSASGFEYWTNQLGSAGLGWHVDCDEKVKDSGLGYICPPISCVFYLGAPDKGGDLEIARETYADCAPEDIDRRFVDVVSAHENRIVIFNPGHWHRVTPTSGQRMAITTNVWDRAISTSLAGFTSIGGAYGS